MICSLAVAMHARTYFRDRESRPNGYRALGFNVATSSSPRKYAGRKDRRTSGRLGDWSRSQQGVLFFTSGQEIVYVLSFAKIALPWQTPAEYIHMWLLARVRLDTRP